MTPRKPRVLVVEDNEEQADAYAELFGVIYTVETVSLFAAAQARLTMAPPVDGIVFDLCLPNGEGVGLVRQLQATQPGVPMVVVTGRGDVTAHEVIGAGAQDFYRKPVDPAVLLASVSKAIERHKVRGEFHEERRLMQEIKQENDRLSRQRTDLLATPPQTGSYKPPSGPPLRGKA